MSELINDLRQDKADLEIQLAKTIRAFEEKYPGFRVEEIISGTYRNPQFKNYGETYVHVTIKVPSI